MSMHESEILPANTGYIAECTETVVARIGCEYAW